MTLQAKLLTVILCGPCVLVSAQITTTPAAAQGSDAVASLSAPSPSATVQPSLDVVKNALTGITVERWKISAAMRDEAQSNLRSIQRDVSTTLPALLASADSAPGSASKLLPAYRNVDALYDVMLRVDVAAHIAAPADQSSGLDQALANLETSRRTLGDQLQQATDVQQGQVVRLQAALKAVPAPAPPPPPAAVPVKCAPAPVRKKPAVKPASSSTSSQTSSTPSQSH